ncbi:hypothetical protein D3C75_821780 [compost metagenome]
MQQQVGAALVVLVQPAQHLADTIGVTAQHGQRQQPQSNPVFVRHPGAQLLAGCRVRRKMPGELGERVINIGLHQFHRLATRVALDGQLQCHVRPVATKATVMMLALGGLGQQCLGIRVGKLLLFFTGRGVVMLLDHPRVALDAVERVHRPSRTL